jgi:putative DNA primase/helicase
MMPRFPHSTAGQKKRACPKWNTPSTQVKQRPGQARSQPDAEVLQRALAAPNGPKFRALWNGDLRAYRHPQTGQPNASSADFALVRLLVYWTNGDAAQVDRLFRQSGLYRPKWGAQQSGHGHTYGEVTIYNALRLAGLVEVDIATTPK